MRIENTLKSFTSKINGVKHLDYWGRLQKLKMYSMGRRIERYRILYIWKILQEEYRIVESHGIIPVQRE